jgi:hypothetical protein
MQKMPPSGSEKRRLNNNLLSVLAELLLFQGKRYCARNEKTKNEKSFKDISLLEKVILSSINKTKGHEEIKINRTVNGNAFDSFPHSLSDELVVSKIDENQERGAIDYSFEAARVKKHSKEEPYFISVTYEDTPEWERIRMAFRVNYAAASNPTTKEAKQNNGFFSQKSAPQNDVYFISVARKKENKSRNDYFVRITYEDNYDMERLSINYKEGIQRYRKRREESLQDFSDRVPGKFVHVFPESIMGGVLGFTYLGENFMGKREDMIGNRMVDVHESIHTDDEYETRLLTSWILSREKPKYIR